MSCRSVFVVVLLASCACVVDVAPADQQATPDQIEFFENRIRPLLVERCFECHNEDVQESDLRLDSLQAMIDGGQRGPSIIPGDAKNSLLIHAVNHSEAELQMPEGDKLLALDIKHLSSWIDDGANWPGQIVKLRKSESRGGPLFTDEEKTFWAANSSPLGQLSGEAIINAQMQLVSSRSSVLSREIEADLYASRDFWLEIVKATKVGVLREIGKGWCGY